MALDRAARHSTLLRARTCYWHMPAERPSPHRADPEPKAATVDLGASLDDLRDELRRVRAALDELGERETATRR